MADQDGRDEDQDFDAQINEEDIVDVIELEGEGGMKLKMSCNHNIQFLSVLVRVSAVYRFFKLIDRSGESRKIAIVNYRLNA